MRNAICADIHCNWEAFSAVSEHPAWVQADRRTFLGDLIGYGPDPEQCWGLLDAGAFDVVTLGNMEDAIENGPGLFRPAVRQAWAWGVAQLLRRHGSKESLLDTMKRAARAHTEGDTIYLHGSPRDPIYEYLRIRNLANEGERTKFRETFAALRRRRLRTCFSAHTHRPGLVTEDLRPIFPAQLEQKKTETGVGGVYRLRDEPTIVNVGSVGMSRDADWRAGFVVFDTGRRQVEFYRTEYDAEKTVGRILSIEELPRELRHRYAEMIARDRDKVMRIATSLLPAGEKTEDQLAREWLEKLEREREGDQGDT